MKTATAFILLSLITLTSCGGGSEPGYLFNIIFIVLPIIFIGHYFHKKIQSAHESLYVMEGQLKRIITKLEKLEEEVTKNDSGSSAKSGKKKQ